MLSAGSQLLFTGGQNFLNQTSIREHFPLDARTRQAKLTSQPVNLPGARPVAKPLDLVEKTPNTLSWEAQLAFLAWASSKLPHVFMF